MLTILRLRTGRLSFGLKGGFDRSNTDYSDILTTTKNDPVFVTNDKPYLLPNLGAGMYYVA